MDDPTHVDWCSLVQALVKVVHVTLPLWNRLLGGEVSSTGLTGAGHMG